MRYVFSSIQAAGLDKNCTGSEMGGFTEASENVREYQKIL